MLQIISLLYVLGTITCVGSSLSHDEECSALFRFKKSMFYHDDVACAASWFHTFDSWKLTNNESNADFDCCSWNGVECSNNDVYSHVVGLDLSESFLCGHINSTSTLFSLVHLQNLNLAMNNFDESKIPSEITNLKQLRSLNLSDSRFTGQIPVEMSQLMQLSSLDLSWNPLKLQSPGGLQNMLQNLTRLEKLDLSGVDISSFVPHFLANFSCLRSIMLQNCSLQNKFPDTILALPNLKFLNVARNTNLTGSFPEFRNNNSLEHIDVDDTNFFGVVPESISNLKHLVYLDLNDCSFSGRIPRALSNSTQITFLGLGSNRFTGFVPSLVSLSKLNNLELSGNKFEQGGLPNWLGELTNLTHLYAYDMDIYGEIPAFLANLTKLQLVSMGRSSLIGHIPSSLFNLTQLGTLDLQKNHMQGPISSSFSAFKTIQHLHLGWNNFSGIVDFNMFLGMNKLETFILGDNKISLVATTNYTNSTLPQLKLVGLSTCNLKEFPSFLRFQDSIEVLVLSRNKIEGMVPVWIWNNSKDTLEVIDLSNNSIIGFHKHPQVLQWERLQILFIKNNQVRGQLPIPPQTTVFYDASNNELTKEIPQLICDVKSLKILSLFSNNMSGPLPPCFSNFSNSLLMLDLSRNNFHGIMMNVFIHGSKLKYIDLSENRFTGHLPRSLINCSKLEFLLLGDNSFDDAFPSWLENIPNMQVLVLRSNKFYGPIQGPTSVPLQFPKLRIMDLSNNGFNGQLHHNYFQTWNAIKSVSVGAFVISDMSFDHFKANATYAITLIQKGGRREYYKKILTIFAAIDLSCNHFEGEIPLSLQDLLGLQSLNLSNNHFSGHVLPSLGYLTNLESLDLSQNNLSGEIPQQLVQLNFLQIFNVSFNHLHGRIPQGQQFNTFENDSYKGNPGLCGNTLSFECEGSNVTTLPPTSNASESLLPSERIDWIIIFCGVGSGLVVGILTGNFLYESNDHEYGHVIGLDLSERFLCGHINSTSTLFSLVHLQSLNLAMNYFNGSQLPFEIGRLKQLRRLNLSDSGFRGKIPNGISQLMQLSSLDLSSNSLKLQSPSGLNTILQNLTGLEELHLSGVDISSYVSHFLVNISSLRSIKLRDCSLQNTFPMAILKLPNLKFLNVARNTNLTGSFPEFHNKSFLEHVDLHRTGFSGIVPKSITNLKHLVFLHLSDCFFSGHIPGSLSNLTQLTFLGLGRNTFIGFVPSLVNSSKLKILEVSGNQFRKQGLPNWLGKLTKLTELYASNMNINGEIPPFLANLTKLRLVAIGKNSLTGHILSSFFNLTLLETLDLRQNQLHGPISSSFSNLKSLQYLHLGSNYFSGRVDLDMFLGLKKLENLVLDENMISIVTTTNYTNSILPELKLLGLSTCNLKDFPAFLRFQNKIEALYLTDNKINGMIPVWIWNNSKETLRVIDLSNNSITGFHKNPQFLQWICLEAFLIKNNHVRGKLPIPPQTTILYDVSDNYFTREIPPLICELKSLQLLDFSSNNMSGTLPPCFGNFTNILSYLDMSRNSFHGIMMNVFMHGSQLKYLDLSENRFTCQLPRSFTNCTNLELLTLGENYFSDVFPSWMGNLPNLQVLVLRSNKFYGPVKYLTADSIKFPKLRIVDLSNNGFSGQLHRNYFQTWNGIKSYSSGGSLFTGSVMSFNSFEAHAPYSVTLIQKGGRRRYNEKVLRIFKSIDLSCNYFDGKIPVSLQDLLGLESLNLSNNHFSGHVLPSLGYLKNLESLDLSHNNLNGEIPQQLVQFNFLAIFNVSFNHLHGHIPQGQQFNTFEKDSFKGNPGLCGKPLFNECQGSNASTIPPARNASESLLPSERIDWIFILCGAGSGLVVGVVIGNFLYERYSDRFTKFTRRNDGWIMPLHNMRRNQGTIVCYLTL
ncbi:hypothetical protein LXL04_037940 [Taraxacum kok-saghyz]